MDKTTKLTYKDVCGKEERIWFEVTPKESKRFLKWAKELGCVWLNGEEIKPRKGLAFYHVSIHADGKIANVAMYAWVAKQFEHVKKYLYSEYVKGNLISPKEYYEQNRKETK